MSRKDTFPNFPLFQRAFSSLFSNDVRTFKFELFHNMNNLEKQLNKETLHEQNSKSDLSVIKVQFDKFLHSKELKPSNYDGCHVKENFKDYTQMEAQSFKDLIIQQMDSIEQSIIERALHQQEIQKRLTRLNDRKLQIQECKVQEVKALNASLGDTDSSGIVSKKGNAHSSENESSRSGNECSERSNYGDDTDIRPSYDTEPMAEANQNAKESDDERAMLDNLIVNLKLDTDKNKKIQKQLKKANAPLTQEMKECKSILEESNRTRDRYLGALHDKEIELAKYKRYNDCAIEKDSLKSKLKETLGFLAQHELDTKEVLKKKGYEISVVKEDTTS
ncbi:hypothetical protein Tco_0727482 [Tanacetum coccineum]|uniref:Leucine zipper transcription factor-like protein 1 n=1 Tax=Tanacetum coccineum TaxID=301880 RepID=A0ABQ4YJI7_9ASTR